MAQCVDQTGACLGASCRHVGLTSRQKRVVVEDVHARATEQLALFF